MKYPQVVPRISGDGSDFLISFGPHAHQKKWKFHRTQLLPYPLNKSKKYHLFYSHCSKLAQLPFEQCSQLLIDDYIGLYFPNLSNNMYIHIREREIWYNIYNIYIYISYETIRDCHHSWWQATRIAGHPRCVEEDAQRSRQAFVADYQARELQRQEVFGSQAVGSGGLFFPLLLRFYTVFGWFPKMEVPPNHPSQMRSFSSWNLWFWNPTILGSLYLTHKHRDIIGNLQRLDGDIDEHWLKIPRKMAMEWGLWRSTSGIVTTQKKHKHILDNMLFFNL